MQLHAEWPERVASLAGEMTEKNIKLVISDIAYLPLAAAQAAQIPNVALCSLNWADVVERYLQSKRASDWSADIKQVYQHADLFILPTPSMAMPWLKNSVEVAPIGRVGKCKRDIVALSVNADDNAFIVLVGMGGIALKLSLQNWPTIINGRSVRYIVPDSLVSGIESPSGCFFPLSKLSMSYHHLMASVDIMLTKPGYGTFVEAAATGLPVIYAVRDDWPDSQSLVSWLSKNGLVRGVTRDKIEEGAFVQEMETLLNQGRYLPIYPYGADQAANVIVSLLQNN